MSLQSSNWGTAPRCTRSMVCAHWDRLAFALETIFPRKTAFNLAALTGLQVRACFQFLARKSSLSSDAVVAMLQSEHGWDVLRALMGDARPNWWADIRAAAEREEIKREIERLQRRLGEK